MAVLGIQVDPLLFRKMEIKGICYILFYNCNFERENNLRWTLAGAVSFGLPGRCAEIGQLTMFEEVSFLVDLIKGIIS